MAKRPGGMGGLRGRRGMCRINAASNTAGPRLLIRVPGLWTLYMGIFPSLLEYGDPKSQHLTMTIAAAVGAPPETVIPIGSTLREIERIPDVVGAKNLVCLRGDFLGYARASALHSLPTWFVDAQTGAEGRPHEDLGNAVRNLELPIVYVTAGLTNPLQTVVDARLVVEAVKRANPEAIVLVDTAYVEYVGLKQADLASLALEHSGVIVLTPASKVLFHAGIAAGWMIIGDEALRNKMLRLAFPYPMPGIAVALLPKLLRAVRAIGTARGKVCQARDTLIASLTDLGLKDRMIAGAGPWVLLDAGDWAGELTAALAEEQILVQRQSGQACALPVNWVRISATVDAEARAIIDAIRRFLRRVA